ncbi:MAG: hypothetical protein GWN87_21230, partial [Desulfuromonadales bacterium]|nr:hypothetical protein [Desulfuromonadales bacterium]
MTELECGVARVALGDGRAVVDPVIVQTRELVVTSGGKVNLETEKIDLQFNTRPRKGIGLSASVVINPFIRVGGTLSQPTLAFDAVDTAISG